MEVRDFKEAYRRKKDPFARSFDYVDFARGFFGSLLAVKCLLEFRVPGRLVFFTLIPFSISEVELLDVVDTFFAQSTPRLLDLPC